MLGVIKETMINEIDMVFMTHIIDHLEKEDDKYMKNYWVTQMRDYLSEFNKRMAPNTIHSIDANPFIETKGL